MVRDYRRDDIFESTLLSIMHSKGTLGRSEIAVPIGRYDGEKFSADASFSLSFFPRFSLEAQRKPQYKP